MIYKCFISILYPFIWGYVKNFSYERGHMWEKFWNLAEFSASGHH